MTLKYDVETEYYPYEVDDVTDAVKHELQKLSKNELIKMLTQDYEIEEALEDYYEDEIKDYYKDEAIESYKDEHPTRFIGQY